MIKKGYVQVYTGGGKGKTTAAIGLSIRMLGAGGRVYFQQFMKAAAYSEHRFFRTLPPEFEWHTTGKPFFIVKEGTASEEELAQYRMNYVVMEEGNPPKDYVELMQKGLEEAAVALASGKYDLVVLDEINCAMHFSLLDTDSVLKAIKEKASNTELVLTGRMAPDEILEEADLVTEMREIKHYYMQGVQARKGIED